MDDFLSEEEARRLWRRAAELQADAARRLEERSRPLEADEEAPGDAREGYHVEHVKAAALEAGIGEEFVRMALAEMRSGEPAERPARVDALADVFLGSGVQFTVASRVYDVPAERTLEALERVLPGPPFELALRDARGGPLLEGGVLVFDVPGLRVGESNTFAYDMRMWSDVTELHLSVRALGVERTEVTLRAPLARNRRLNLWVGGALVTGGGGIVGALAAGLAAAAAGGAGLAAALVLLVGFLAGLVGLGAAGVAGTAAYRPLYRLGLRKGREAMERVLQTVAVHLRTGGAFSKGLPGSAPPRLAEPGQDAADPDGSQPST